MLACLCSALKVFVMVRSSVRICGQLVLSVALSWALIPVVSAHAQSSETPAAESAQPAGEPPASEMPASETPAEVSPGSDAPALATPTAEAPVSEPSSSSSTAASSEPSEKSISTIPEDGLGDVEWLSGSTRIVREITLKRPAEDLVICIAGCVDKQDRVVFAQPTDMTPKKKPDDTVSDAAPTPAKPGSADAGSVPATKTGAATAVKSADTKADGSPAIGSAAKAGASADMKKSEFQPAMAQPKAPEAPAMPAANASEGAAPPSK
jgi:hypothetical protein